MTDTSARRPGRRSGESTTRDDIVSAAQKLFGRNGFKGTSMRSVAAEAGVDVALVSYYFGNKRGLFVAALDVPINPADQIARATAGPRDQLGTGMITEFTGVWEGEKASALQGLLRTAINDESQASAFAEFASSEMVPLVAESLDVPIETARIVVSMLFGVATMRYLLRLPLFVELTRDEVIAQWGPRLQQVIDSSG